jgi:hypothetical protein
MPASTFYRWNQLGLPAMPMHRYPVSVVYDNPTGRLIRNGGVGAVGGLRVPDRAGSGARSFDPSDCRYRADLRATLRLEGGGEMDMSGMDPISERE